VLERVEFSASDLASLRALVSRHATRARLAPEAREDLVLAVNELVSNSVQYGGGVGELRIWQERDALLCEVRDRGRICDPLAGRVRPRRDQFGGRGLWLVNQLCDLVQIRVTPAGTVVRVHMQLG
jgi:anti-sigma regulatory factor (Ser/Thr protein kinase)